MKPNHVRVHAFRVNRMAANLAGHSADGLRYRLLQQWFTSSLPPTPGFMTGPLAFRSFPAAQGPSAMAAASCIEESFRSSKLP